MCKIALMFTYKNVFLNVDLDVQENSETLVQGLFKGTEVKESFLKNDSLNIDYNGLKYSIKDQDKTRYGFEVYRRDSAGGEYLLKQDIYTKVPWSISQAYEVLVKSYGHREGFSFECLGCLLNQ